MASKRRKSKVDAPDFPKWADLLTNAVSISGYVEECYHAFHDYSPGNQMLAMWQCELRDIEPGPIGTYKFWKDMGRQVTSGPGSAIYLCRPTSWTHHENDLVDDDGSPAPTSHIYTSFKYEPRWFVLSQTQGEEYIPPPLPEWHLGNALWNLGVEEVSFIDTNGNCMGYSQGRYFAVNPLNKHANATMMHELAHIVLGHTEESQFPMVDGRNRTPTDVRELEAECTALIILDQLGDKDHAASRGYIQAWYSGNTVPEESARKIFSAANSILVAGRSTHTGTSEKV